MCGRAPSSPTLPAICPRRASRSAMFQAMPDLPRSWRSPRWNRPARRSAGSRRPLCRRAWWIAGWTICCSGSRSWGRWRRSPSPSCHRPPPRSARLRIVAFPSAAAAKQAAIGGNVAAAALGLSSTIGDLREGRLVGLGIAATNRADAFPDMPPLRESGLDLSAVIRRGLAAPVGLPESIAQRLSHALEAVVEDLEFHDQADTNGFVAGWQDGATWMAKAQDERGELARLWKTEPWLQEAAE